MKAFCKHYEKEKVITKAESLVIQNKYKNGFHVYFQPIAGDEKEPLFRTAEYIASGFFHTNPHILTYCRILSSALPQREGDFIENYFK
ncbi:MAG: hypothetical protein IPO06_04050 [Leptospiraceae bacterium]|nr:hypothetical protein [Leptospiraceae bacterium]